MKIGDEIKIVQEFLIEQNKRNQRLIDNPYRQLFYTDEEVQAIENILFDYKRVLKKNEELKLDKLEMQKTIKEMAKHIEKYCTSFPENYGANAEEWEKYFRERCK